jgi:two-component system, cell cycle response regulator
MIVLVLERSRLFQKLLTGMLEEMGCEVDCGRTGSDGLSLLEKTDYGLIIASQHIFDESGAEFGQYCQQEHSNRPVIMLTSDPNETLMNNARKAGVTDVFPKGNLTYLQENIRYYIEGDQGINIQGGRVIYIEDSASVAYVIKGYLKKLNLEVEHYTSAEKGLKVCAEKEFDLLITDIELEGPMTGLSLSRMIRGQKNILSEIPILAMTGHDESQTRIELFRSGVNDYVTKPAIEEELAARVNNLISNKRLLDQVREQKKALYELAMTDQLTSCFNRHCLIDEAPKLIAEAVRYNYPICLMVLDLDHFKRVNDDHGHATGDEVLATIGRTLISACRQGDFVARIGGEEFIVMLPYCDKASGMRKSEDIRLTVEARKPAGLTVTCSIGVACLNTHREASFDDLYRAADQATYLSKENGRNRVTFYNDDIGVNSGELA